MKRVGAILSVVIAGFVLSWAYLSGSGDERESGEADTDTGFYSRADDEATVVDAAPESEVANLNSDVADKEGIAHVERKYKYILEDVTLPPANRRALLALLLKRELGMSAAEEVGIDTQLRSMLGAAGYERYRSLERSDVEQQQLMAYAGGINSVAPLDSKQERTILFAKLREKERYEALIRNSGLNREELSATEREYAHDAVNEALREYRENYLMEVQPALSEEQYLLLSSFETTEFEQELQRLQIAINLK